MSHSMNQLSLLAYYNLEPKLNARELMILQALRNQNSMTAWELINHFDFKNPNNIRPRLTDLFKKGLIIKTGVKFNQNYNCTETIWKTI